MNFNKIYEVTHNLDAPLQPIEDGSPVREGINTLFEQIYKNSLYERIYKEALREQKQYVKPTPEIINNLPIIANIEYDKTELYFIEQINNWNKMPNNKEKAELKRKLKTEGKGIPTDEFRKHYLEIFNDNFKGTEVINKNSQIELQIVRDGITDSTTQMSADKWCLIRYLKQLIEKSIYMGQHPTTDHTDKYDTVYIFMGKCTINKELFQVIIKALRPIGKTLQHTKNFHNIKAKGLETDTISITKL